jgi:hypothetical protein
MGLDFWRKLLLFPMKFTQTQSKHLNIIGRSTCNPLEEINSVISTLLIIFCIIKKEISTRQDFIPQFQGLIINLVCASEFWFG